MTTYTWNSGPANWTDPDFWTAGSTTPAGPPGPGDTADIINGTVELGMALHHIQITLDPQSDLTAEILATNVELGDNVVLTGNSGGATVNYEVVGTGTLDDGNPTQGLTPKPGAIVSSVVNFVLAAGGGSNNPIFINDGSISGVLAIRTATGTASGTFENNETIVTPSVNIQAGVTMSGTGVVVVAGSGSTDGAVDSGATFDVTNTLSGDFLIGDITTFQGEVVLTQTDAIFLPGFDSGEKSYSAGVLTFDNGATLRVTPGGRAHGFIVLPSAAQTDVYAIACFAAGTRIATPDGEVAVEHLRPGDDVRLASGDAAEVRWVGHRRVRCAQHPRPHDVFPVRIRAGAFAPGQPTRDLRLSPDHAVMVDGALIPVRYLLNGASIAVEPVGEVTYHHVELERHDVLLAEGLPAESFLDTGNRTAFEGKARPPAAKVQGSL